MAPKEIVFQKQNPILAYYEKINSGEVVVGSWIKLLYEMILKGLQNREFFFDEKKAAKAIRFIETFCHHCEGRDDLLKLELWQKATTSLIFGIVDESGLRVFREIVMIVARKQGKTLFASAIIAYLAYIDGEYGAKIYCLAPKLEQAHIVYDNFYEMIKKEAELSDISLKRRSDIYIEETNTAVKPLAFSAKKSDGFNPHGVIADEFASWRGDQGLKQYEVMKSGFGARRQPMLFAISTAGYENDGIYDELVKRGTAVLKGSSNEKRLLPIFYMIDDPSKWNKLEELRKANPNMGISVPEGFFLDEIAIAESSVSKKREFLTKYCNVKQNSSIAWLEYQAVEDALKGAENLTLEDFRGCYAVGGVDLSKTVDLTAASVDITKRGVSYGFTQFFMPAANLEAAQARDRVPYEIFIQQGFLTLSGDNHVNYKDIYQWFVDLHKRYEIYLLKIGYDRYCATYLVEDLKSYGFQLDDVNQGYNLSSVMDEFEGDLKDQKYKIGGGNHLLASHFLNVAVKQDLETRKNKPVKIEQRSHIDGFVSVIDARTVRQKYYNEIGSMLNNE